MRERAVLAPQFSDLARQTEAARFGMWAFLGSEALLFTGIFALYASYRALYPAEFGLAVTHNDATIGTINTLVLLTSSFTVALAVHEVRVDRPRRAAMLLGLSIAMAFMFLVFKGLEYAEHFHAGIYPGTSYRFAELPGYGPQVFFTLYFLATGLHALHVLAGSLVLAALAIGSWRGLYSPLYHTPLELGALYWHLVDIVWIFLWPCLYLMQ
jgi:cytochrome c oxidase subunit III